MRDILSTTLVASLVIVGGDLAAEPADVDSKEPSERPVRPVQAPVYFDFDVSELDAEARTGLDAVASWAKEKPKRSIILVGHADPVGSRDYNRELGDARAANARDYLLEQGVPAAQISITSVGEAHADGKKRDLADRKVVVMADRPTSKPPRKAPPLPPSTPPAPPAEPRLRMVAPPVYVVDDDPARMARKLFPFTMSVRLSAGVMSFLQDDSRAVTSTGGAWEARLTLGTRSILGTELAYLGSAQDVEADGLMGDSSLIGSGAEAALRFNAPALGRVLQPYALAGVGFMNYSLVDDGLNESMLDDSATAVHVPVALGLAIRAGRTIFDIRGTVRPAFQDELGQSPSTGETTGLDSWAATMGAGVEF